MFYQDFENVMSIMNLKELIVATWEHIFLGDTTWNLAVFYALITEFLYSTGLQSFTWTLDYI